MGNCCKKKVKKDDIYPNINSTSLLIPDSHQASYYKPPTPYIPKLEEFKKISVLGKGSFGKVVLVKLIPTNKYYAMKILKKRFIILNNQVNQIMAERGVLEKLENPFIVKLYYAFQDNSRLYFITDFMQGGELFFHLRKNSNYQESDVIFYSSEILCAIEYMHKTNCMYRDLKPENILIDKYGHICITDFGLSKILQSSNEKTYTLCGTPEYMAPEILMNNGYDKTCDWFSFGVLIYQMICGNIPFKQNESHLGIKVYYQPIRTPTNISYNARDIIEKLLEINPNERLGFNGTDEIKKHPFFANVNFEQIQNKQYKPPFVPHLKNDEDLKYFHQGFVEEKVESFSKKKTEESPKSHIFKGFIFQENEVNKSEEKSINNEKSEYC